MRDAALARGRSEEEADAPVIERLKRRNTWTCQVARQHPELVAFISLDPGMGEADAAFQSSVAPGADSPSPVRAMRRADTS